MDEEQLDQTRRILINALDALAEQGVPGALIACLLPEGDSLIRAGGVCTDLHGACLGLEVAVTAFRGLALNDGREDLAKPLQAAAEALRVAIQTAAQDGGH